MVKSINIKLQSPGASTLLGCSANRSGVVRYAWNLIFYYLFTVCSGGYEMGIGYVLREINVIRVINL